MEAKHYQLESKRILNTISELEKEHRQLAHDYIIANKRFDMQQEVLLIGQPNKKGSPKETVKVYVNGIRINSDGTLNYTFYKIKKDGSKSVQRFYAYQAFEHFEITLPDLGNKS